MESIRDTLARLLGQAELLAGNLKSIFRQGALQSPEARIADALSRESDPDRRGKLTSILAELQGILSQGAAGKDEPLLVIEEFPLEASITLIPQGKGKSIEPARIQKELGRRGLGKNISSPAIDAAAKSVARGELVYSLKVAEGVPPVDGEDASIEFAVRAFDKRLFLDPAMPTQEALLTDAERVEAGSRVATLRPSTPGRSGTDVRGRLLPPASGKDLSFRPGASLRMESDDGALTALSSGCLVVSDDLIEIVPFRIFEGGLALSEALELPGNVIVRGHLTGTATLSARDVYVEGNVEGASIQASGDVVVGGTLLGKSHVRSDGVTLANDIRDADVESLGDVLVRHSIIEGRVVSGGWVRVGPEPGAIEGGAVSGRKGIVARLVGSDWGIETSISAGRDMLSAARLAGVQKGIDQGKAELRRMGPLLPPSAVEGSDLADATPEQWQGSAELLERAGTILRQLTTLWRTKEKLDQARGDVTRASIQILGRLLPPVQVGIGPAVHVFREPLGHAVLVLGHNKKIRLKDEEEPKRPPPSRERKTRVRHSG